MFENLYLWSKIGDALSDPDFPKDKRALVVSACYYFYPLLRELTCWPNSDGAKSATHEDKEAVIRACRVIDVSGPPELFKETESILSLYALKHPAIADELVVHALERANMAYADINKNANLWRKLADIEPAAGYAFTALLEMSLFDEVIDDVLPKLAKHVKEDGWDLPIDNYLRFAKGKQEIARKNLLIKAYK